MKGFYGFLHKMIAGPLRLIFNVRTIGLENEPSPNGNALLVCSNHISAGDPIWISIALRKHHPFFMAKAELFKIPLLGWLIRRFGAYPVDRGGADVSSIKNTISILKNGGCIGMFPQGTRRNSDNPAATPVKGGVGMIAARSNCDVLPIFIKTNEYRSSVFGRKTIIIGKPISACVIKDMHTRGMTYHTISQHIFSEICSQANIEYTYYKTNDDEQ